MDNTNNQSSNGLLIENQKSVIDKEQSEQSISKLRIPDGAEALPFQIAGHRFSKPKFGVLKHSQSGDILKPIYDKRGKREQLFYETIFSELNDNDSCVVSLRKIVPKYNGLFHDDNMNINYIRLGDVTAQMSNISLLDIKMGYITYDPEAPEEKRVSQKNKYKYAKDLGFRILGMRVYNRSTKEFIYKNNEFGLQITPETASEALLMFANNDTNLLKEFIKQLDDIENWFTKHNIDRWKLISSSLLFAYGDIDNNNNNNDNKTNICPQTNVQENSGNTSSTMALVKIIDFAHVFPNVGLDENYLFGLHKLKDHFQKALEIV